MKYKPQLSIANKPLRDIVLNKDELLRHAADIAQLHSHADTGVYKSLFPRVAENMHFLRFAHREIMGYVETTRDIVPAAEWFLDNYYLLKDLKQDIRANLPRRYERQLSRVGSGALQGYPRIFALMVEFIEHTDSQVNTESLKEFVNKYQGAVPLSSGELWAVPIMLKIALLENTRRLVEQILITQVERLEADRWLTPLLSSELERENWQEILQKSPKPEFFSPTFTERLARRFRELGPEGAPILQWLDKVLAKQDTTVEDLANYEHQTQAMCQVSMGHAIVSIRLLGEEDWPRFVEEISQVEKILRADPSGIYLAMDFESRDEYRHQVEKKARKFRVSESVIAKKALSKAEEAKEDGLPGSHVGYYLLGQGCKDLEAELEREWGVLRHLWSRLQRVVRNNPLSVYFGGIITIGVGITLPLWSVLQREASSVFGTSITLLCLAFFPISSLAIAVVNWLVTKIINPTFFPKLELRDGIPQDLRTLVVVPTLLTSTERVQELLEQMEVYHLANQDNNLHFALLGDYGDADQADMAEDKGIIAAAINGINTLGTKYGNDRFFLFHRKRDWNPAEGVWMGWERKRGKLIEFNQLLLGDSSTSYTVQVGNLSVLKNVRYVITLDADTQLPKDTAKKLVGTMAHPLHMPKLSEDQTRVVSGYGIMQPRIGVSVLSAGSSFFARVYSGKVGIDPYTSAVSDVYQDLFGEGNFTGKGIYDLHIFHQVTGGSFPENTILSHDLLEGIYARTGLVTDIELVDGYPGKYHSYMRRLHRWVRGDWQILPWLFKPLPLISRWKIFDNLRRSLDAPAQVVLLLVAFTAFRAKPWLWAGIVMLNLFLPPILTLLSNVITPGKRNTGLDLSKGLLQSFLQFVFLPYQAYIQFDAVVRSLTRQLVTHRKLLEWETADAAERRLSVSPKSFWLAMWPASGIGALLLGLAVLSDSTRAVEALPIAILWFVSPTLAYKISLPLSRAGERLSLSEQAELAIWSRKIWAFFEDYVTERENWLPPDNIQIDPPNGIAHRTSPTNIGLALLANLAAKDLGYIGIKTLCQRLQGTLATLNKLDRWKGHLFNWYDTLTLNPLHPLYVSTVDSGNLVIYLITLNSGLSEVLFQPVFSHSKIEAVRTSFALVDSNTGQSNADFALELREVGDQCDVETWYKFLDTWADRYGLGSENRWEGRLRRMLVEQRNELRVFYPWLGSTKPCPWDTHLTERLYGLGLEALTEEYSRLMENSNLAELLTSSLQELKTLVEDIKNIQLDTQGITTGIDFKPLYDPHRQLFSIGYRIGEQALDKSYYDLLASEARQASFLAVAKGDVPKSHWFRLGRSLTKVNSQRSLVAWTGTMFEFLMPLLVMRNYPGTLLDETYQAVVEVQRMYGTKAGIPWGISESGFYAFDSALNYQYKAFGVPGLGLKRGLAQDLVISPYSTFLALMIAPREALSNLNRMKKLGFAGEYGLYEAIDYTVGRVPNGQFKIVKSFMAHHQGMSFLALVNVLQDGCMQRRLHKDPLMQSVELLLQERVPATRDINTQAHERLLGHVEKQAAPDENRFVTINSADSLVPVTHFVSNGHFSTMVTNSGSGFSKFNEIMISRWREDVTRDAWGMYFYIQNLNSGSYWSAAHMPVGSSGENYQVTYAPDRVEFCRQDGNIRTKTEIVVSPEDAVEVRRISLTNHSQSDRTLEITSYFEIVLARLNEDLAHPAFGNLFIETEYTNGALLASRRPRREGQVRPWLMHAVALEGEGIGGVQYETDRSKFIGRGRNLARPRALEVNKPLSNTVGAVLDPIMSLRQRIRIRPGETVRVSFSVGIAKSREEIVHLAEKYRDTAAVDRVFELAWTYSQMELRHLNLPPLQANEALALGGNLLYLSPCRRDYGEILARNSMGQSALWPHAISGDLPVVLLRVWEKEHLDLVRQFLVVHEYWRLKGMQLDLVILNEDKSGYYQVMHEQLRNLVSTGHARELLHRPGGVFLLQKNHLSQAELDLIYTVARVVFSGEGGSCSVQLRKQGKLLTVKAKVTSYPPRAIGLEESETTEQDKEFAAKPNLLYFNGYGGFSQDGREYLIELGKGMHTPLPWINVIANPKFGFHVSESGSGYTWSSNSRENKLTPWSNDPVVDQPGEVIYLRDEATGEVWTTTRGPIRDQDKYLIRHGQGYSTFSHSSHGLHQELVMFVPVEQPVKLSQLSLQNTTGIKRRLTVTYYAELVLGVARELTAPYLVTDFLPEQTAILARNTYQEEFAGRIAFLKGFGGTLRSYTGDRTEFLGRNGHYSNPAGLKTERLSNQAGPGFDPCAAIQLEVELEPGEEKKLLFAFGEAASLAELENIVDGYNEERAVARELTKVKTFWDSVLGTVQVSTPDKSMDLLLNRWLLYQTLVCRIWARSAFYQSGGAYGFRDQLQDVMALVVARPHLAREQILRHCAHQFVEGDVQHWWHPERSKGIRTKFSDDLLWLPFVTAHYVEHTGDFGILTETTEFLEDAPLGEEEDERYSIPRVSAETGDVYEHCIRALERGLQFGEHGLPLIGSGDWNDGFSRIGVKGKGESIWLGWFIYTTLQRFVPICHFRADAERAQRYLQIAEELKENLDKHGWDGGWYRRAYFDDGTPLGSARNDECQIDCIAQAWAVISGAAKPSRARDAMLALEHYLLRKDEGILLLLTPPFNQSLPDPGYIKGYVPGVRENGGQYTHGAIWAILAYAGMGRGDKAAKLFHMLNPINHARTETEVSHYKVEPYVMTADVYTVSPHIGRGGWSWYTGASGWMYQVGMEGILGFRLQGDHLVINPCIPGDWREYSIKYMHGATLYNINVENPQRRMTGVAEIYLDGKILAADAIPLLDDGIDHNVRVIM